MDDERSSEQGVILTIDTHDVMVYPLSDSVCNTFSDQSIGVARALEP